MVQRRGIVLGVHRTRLGVLTRRFLVYTHRWLGIVLGALFIAWFVSGVVMMYAGMPRLTPGERLAHLPALDFTTATLAPAAHALGVSPGALRLGMVDGRPVYRLTSGRVSTAVYADTGAPVGPVDAPTAVAQARRFFPEHRGTIAHDARIVEPDQWTLEIARQLPMHRIAVNDAADRMLYVSESTGEVLLETTATSRRWAYPGAILHWIYLTPIRRHTEAWAQFIIWTSVLGTFTAVVGVGWGLWRFSPSARFRLKRVQSRSPYSGWMAWHHYAGLIFGLTTMTWIFSGLLSMDPWDWHPGTSPTAAQRAAFAGGAFSIEGLSADDLRKALQRLGNPREADVVQSAGRRWLATNMGVAPLDAGAARLPLEEQAVADAAYAAMPDAPVADITELTSYDSYYYDRGGELPLPVFRVRYDDPVRTWLYVDATRGTVLRKEERLTRVNRWLYHGLHSLDFPFLYFRRPLWDVVVIVLSIGGLALSLTPVSPAFARLRRIAITRRS